MSTFAHTLKTKRMVCLLHFAQTFPKTFQKSKLIFHENFPHFWIHRIKIKVPLKWPICSLHITFVQIACIYGKTSTFQI